MKIYVAILIMLIAAACGNNEQQNEHVLETTSKGSIRISVDETFYPVINEQLKVFHSSYPNATINAQFKPEAECLRDLQNDSVRMVVISRGLTKEENKIFNDAWGYRPIFGELANDAVAVIINNATRDSVYTLEDIRKLLLQPNYRNMSVAVDGKSATSTVRYLIDSVLNGQPLGKHVTGANSSADLINYIASTTNAIGFVGISWITNPQTKEQAQAVQKVKMALIECQNCEKDVFAKPTQQTIMFHQYPLVRTLYYVLKENFSGVGSGFVNFMTLERGQLIFKRASLVPTQMQLNQRQTQISETE